MEDISNLRAIAVDIDNDDFLTPNVLNCEVVDDGVLRDWGHGGICFRRRVGSEQNKVKLKKLPPTLIPTILQLFENLLLKDCTETIMLPGINKNMVRI